MLWGGGSGPFGGVVAERVGVEGGAAFAARSQAKALRCHASLQPAQRLGGLVALYPRYPLRSQSQVGGGGWVKFR